MSGDYDFNSNPFEDEPEPNPGRGNGRDKHPPLRIREFEEIEFDPTTDISLVEGLLFPGELSLLDGPPNCGKTFLALDLSLTVSRGGDQDGEWLGRKVTQGRVVYLACEGGRRIDKRITAWKRHHGYQKGEPLPFSVITEPVDLCHLDSADTDRVIEAIAGTASGAPPVLIVIETVNAVLAGGNENAPDDMGRLLTNIRRLREAFPGCHILLVHHPARGGTGPRGHSSLPAAVDTILDASRDEASKITTITMTKQREAEIAAPFIFRLHVVELGYNTDGELVTSCVVKPAEAAAPAPKQRKLPIQEARALAMLTEAVNTGGMIPPADNHIPTQTRCVPETLWRRYCYQGGISDGDQDAKQKAFRRARGALLGAGLVGIWDDWVWRT